MWEIEQFAIPFIIVKDSITFYWKTFIEDFKAPYIFLSERMKAILNNASLLSVEEICDVEASWEEIEQDRIKKFTNVDEFLEELKS